MSLCLVTGGAGFIGSHLADGLLRAGHRVRILDDLSTGKRENVPAAAELIRGDLRRSDDVRAAMQGVDLVLHQAALPSVARSLEDPAGCFEVNVRGLVHLLEAARSVGARRVVVAGSSSVYGDAPELPKREEMGFHPLSPYAASKAAAEIYCGAWHRLYGLPTVVLRYFNVFGPRQDPSSEYSAVIPRFASALLKGEAPVICGDGRQSRDFTYVDNVVDANLLALSAPGAPGGIFNIACGERIDLLTLVGLLQELTGRRIAPRHAPPRVGDVPHSLADVTRARELLGFRPRVDFKEGLRRTVEALRLGRPERD